MQGGSEGGNEAPRYFVHTPCIYMVRTREDQEILREPASLINKVA